MGKSFSKCKNCGSELWFNPKQNCLTCKHCESNYFLPKKSQDAVLIRQYDAGFHPNQLNQNLNAYKCEGCGNIYYMSSEEKSKKCPNCGHSSCSLVSDNGYCADGVIPFTVSKETAAKCFSDYLKSKKYIPKDLKKLAETSKLTGIFLPVWNFSFNIDAMFSATASELKKDFQGMYYTVAKPVFGEEHERIKSLDASATNATDDAFLELFDENDYARIIPYITEYTYGYKVASINKDIHDYYYQITSEAEKRLEKKIKHNVVNKYKEVRDVEVNSKANDVFFNFTYVPVYVNTFAYRGKVYRTYVSGTTGKVIGKTPVSIKKKIKRFIGTVAFLGIAALIAYLFIL